METSPWITAFLQYVKVAIVSLTASTQKGISYQTTVSLIEPRN